MNYQEIVCDLHYLGKYHLHTQYKTWPKLSHFYYKHELSWTNYGVNQGKSAAKPTENIVPKPQNLRLKLSQPKRARRLIFEKICFEPTFHTFTTIESEERPNVVVLFPKKKSCSCPSTTQCDHILAAKMSIRIDNNHQKGKVNLTQLQTNAHS